MPAQKWQTVAPSISQNTSKPRQMQIAETRSARQEQKLQYHQSRLPDPSALAAIQPGQFEPALHYNLELLKFGLYWLYGLYGHVSDPHTTLPLKEKTFRRWVETAVDVARKAVAKDKRACRAHATSGVDSQSFLYILRNDLPCYQDHMPMFDVINQAVGGPGDNMKTLDLNASDAKYKYAYLETLERIYNMVQYTMKRGEFTRENKNVRDVLLKWAKSQLSDCIENLRSLSRQS